MANLQVSPNPLSLKKLLLKNDNWYRFEKDRAYWGKPVRDAVKRAITQLLSCQHYARGHAQYHCANKKCTHEKRVPFTCKNRMCNSCGKLASDKWVAKQLHTLPRTEWQHITMTMPSELWPFFEVNRELLNELPKIASKVLLRLAKAKGIMPGIFTALHTFGRDLKWNVHVHISVTRGGLTNDLQWKSMYYRAKSIMTMWRYAIIKLIKKKHQEKKIILPDEVHFIMFKKFIEAQYRKRWHIHCAKPQNNAEKDIAYLGRYIKRPPLANSRLVHYSGGDLVYKYHDHHSNTEKTTKISVQFFLMKFIKHIPERGFRMIRYYGFLANRVRGKLLPIVNALTDTTQEHDKPIHVSWRTLYKKTFGGNPLSCILCKSQLRLSGVFVGLSAYQIQKHSQDFALQKIIRL